mmetsp:Transcript_19457/g.45236  ORF Transcript_19457/g.45236 Transcript_19457/m.45236 type:complete len:273 (+) Transcript_19457:61-879(+)
MEEGDDLVLGWMIRQDGSAPIEGATIYSADERANIQKHVLSEEWHAGKNPLFVTLDSGNSCWGLVACARSRKERAKSTLQLFQGLCKLEGMAEGREYILCPSASAAENKLGSEVLLLTQEVFLVLQSRVWARRRLVDSVKESLPPLGQPEAGVTAAKCPFDESGTIVLSLEDDEAIGQHYLQLLLGRGPVSQCPRACKYLQGVARDLSMKDLPYASEVLCGRAHCQAEDAVLDVLRNFDQTPGEVPVDFSEDLALVVANKALKLVEIMGLEL